MGFENQELQPEWGSALVLRGHTPDSCCNVIYAASVKVIKLSNRIRKFGISIRPGCADLILA